MDLTETRTFIIAVAVALVVSFLIAGAVAAFGRMTDNIRFSNAPECMEDMPCWDCETMGNRICGPIQP